MMRLCKGLHYVLWMQDKMLLQVFLFLTWFVRLAYDVFQEELANRISQLLLVFSNEEQRVLFIQSTFKSLAKEWNHIDRWRMDKFLMVGKYLHQLKVRAGSVVLLLKLRKVILFGDLLLCIILATSQNDYVWDDASCPSRVIQALELNEVEEICPWCVLGCVLSHNDVGRLLLCWNSTHVNFTSELVKSVRC